MENAPAFSPPRRSQRVSTAQPVDVEWKRTDGLRVREAAQAEVVSTHGALLRLQAIPPRDSEVKLKQPSGHQSVAARVVRVEPARADGVPRVAVELAAPSPAFWTLPDDRRTSPRYQVGADTFAYFYPADAESTGTVRNLSLGGVYVEDPGNNFTEETELDLELRLEGEKMTFRVVVTRSYPNQGFAARFLDYSTELKEQLEKYLRNVAD
jgi:hypothetical protein